MTNPGATTALSAYYANYFPADVLCELLSRSWRGQSQLHKRELCIENVDACYIRWLSVASHDELRVLFKDKRVEKFHTGAIFSNEPRFKKKGLEMSPIERELVFDIDVNDYAVWGIDANDIASCDYAWPIVAFGMKMVKHVLRHHFGFENILLVYSGRRGAHMSVYDARACVLTDEARSAIVAYLQPPDNPGTTGRLQYRRICESTGFTQLFDSHVLLFWLNFCVKPRSRGGMGVLDGPLEKEAFMDLFADEHASNTLTWTGYTGAQMWTKLTKYADESMYSQSKWTALKETVMCYIWPRLDVAVSKHRHHLSKSVFSIHPRTKRVCVPIKGDSFLFKPSDCPKYTDVVEKPGNALDSFIKAVAVLKRFLALLKASKSEQWQAPRLNVVPSSSFSMVSRKRERDDDGVDKLAGQYMFTDRKRLCGHTTRVFCVVASDADPSTVSVFFYTKLHDPCVDEVLAGYAPPFRKPGPFPIGAFVNGVSKASANPGTEVIVDEAYTCVLFHPQQTSRLKCETRLKRLETSMLSPNEVTVVNSKWDESALTSMIKDQVKQVWDTKYIHFN
jgi:DNA primase small subunit